ncbi:MAG: DUF3160 domain-containing protein [Deltaproteobacteria bacterium]|nr:DUF3160 domain-containing protein [Deltaproteobacteria bacterium]
MLRKAILAVVFLGLLAAGQSGPVRAQTKGGLKTTAPEGMFALYQQNRAQQKPNYITEDFILLAYSVILNEAVTELEEKVLSPGLKDLVSRLIKALTESQAQDEAARANLNFLSVLEGLLCGQKRPASAADPQAVAQELERIRQAGRMDLSGVVSQKIDYTQFKVRGKYTRNETLGRYFQAVRYAGTVLFPVLESKATAITAQQADRLTSQALMLTRLIFDNSQARKIYNDFNSDLSWIFGPPDDLVSADYDQVQRAMKDAPLPDIRRALLDLARKTGRQPAIISAVVNTAALGQGVSAQDAVTGWRFLPLRFSPDAAAFQQLVYDKVQAYQGQKPAYTTVLVQGKLVKGLPLGLELMALLGSEAAQKKLAASGDQDYEGYQEAAAEAQKMLALPAGLASENIKLMTYWLKEGQAAQPDGLRRLRSCLAFWTYQRYVSLLYAKQSYTAVGKSLVISKKRETAWLEPAPELYSQLEEMTAQLRSRLESRPLEAFSEVLKECRAISLKEIKGQALDQEEIAFLNDLDQKLLSLTGRPDKPIVVDVHTEPGSQEVLEEALGRPLVVHKKVGDDQARGALFSYYEFKHPMSDRLTDDQWRAILRDQKKVEALKLSPGSLPGPTQKGQAG